MHVSCGYHKRREADQGQWSGSFVSLAKGARGQPGFVLISLDQSWFLNKIWKEGMAVEEAPIDICYKQWCPGSCFSLYLLGQPWGTLQTCGFGRGKGKRLWEIGTFLPLSSGLVNHCHLGASFHHFPCPSPFTSTEEKTSSLPGFPPSLLLCSPLTVKA